MSPDTPSSQHRSSDQVADEVSPSVRVAAAWTWRIAVVAAGIYGLLWLLGEFRVLVVPVLLALLISALAMPLVTVLARWMPRGLAVALTVISGLALLGGLFTLVGTQLAAGLSDLGRQAGQGYDQVQAWLGDGPLNLGDDQVSSYVAQAREQLSASSDEIMAGAVTVTAVTTEVITGLLLAVLTLVFFLHDGERIWGWLVQLFPKPARAPLDTAGRDGCER